MPDTDAYRTPPNPRLQRTPSASPPSPLSRKPLDGRSRAEAAVTVIAVAVVLGCGVGEGKLARRVRSEASHEGATIRLADMTSFAWDRVCLLGPYTMRNEAEACLGFAWPQFESTGLDMADQFSLMVFAASERVVHVEPLSRELDFSAEIVKRPFRPRDAVFRLAIATSGRRELVRAAV